MDILEYYNTFIYIIMNKFNGFVVDAQHSKKCNKTTKRPF